MTADQETRNDSVQVPHPTGLPRRFSLSSLLLLILLAALGSAYLVTLSRLRKAHAELDMLRSEVGYLIPTGEKEIAGVRVASDSPLTYKLRVRVPETPKYRVAYSSVWPEAKAGPVWFGAVAVPPGESVVTVRVLKDPRDDRWKIATLRRSTDGTRRMATALPADQVDIFRGSHDWIRFGVSEQTSTRPAGESLRLLDERALVGEGAMMLYGDKPPAGDMVGIYAELQPDLGAF